MTYANLNTDRTTVLALDIKQLYLDNKVAYGLGDIFYGKHIMIPQSPTVVVMSGITVRTLQGVAGPGGKVKNELNIIIDVMADDVLGGEEAGRLAVDTLAEDLEKLLYLDVTRNGLVIHGFVQRKDPGEITINNSTWRTVRMTYVGESRTYLSPPAAPA